MWGDCERVGARRRAHRPERAARDATTRGAWEYGGEEAAGEEEAEHGFANGEGAEVVLVELEGAMCGHHDMEGGVDSHTTRESGFSCAH